MVSRGSYTASSAPYSESTAVWIKLKKPGFTAGI
jgi:hypothetical protein